MLDVNNVNFNTLPKSYRKDWRIWKYSMSTLGEMLIEKTEEGRKLIQNKCASVPNKYFWGRGRYRSGVSPTFPAGSFVCRAGRAAFFHGNLQTFSGKVPLTTKNVPTTKRRDFQTQTDWLSKTDDTNTKMQMSLRKQTETQECKWHK